jgi:hypothetical protein
VCSSDLKPIDLFAYPFGYYNNLDIATLKVAGYRAARTDIQSPYRNTKDNLFTLDGTEVTDDFSKFIQDIKL